MPSSDSEGFESADEGHSVGSRKERKSRLSSSNYSDLASDVETKAPSSSSQGQAKDVVKQQEGWDDFNIDDNDLVTTNPSKEIEGKSKTTTVEKPGLECSPITAPQPKPAYQETVEKPGLECSPITAPQPKPAPQETVEKPGLECSPKTAPQPKPTPQENTQDTGWDDFGDWGNEPVDNSSKNHQKDIPKEQIKEVADRLAAVSTNDPPKSGGGWGWGWGMDSILNSASAGITTLTEQVSQGITTVLETGIGAPDPEELARKAKEGQSTKTTTEEVPRTEDTKSGSDAFQFGSILKFVGDTGSKVITGGLDTLETIGRKTMEVLQDGDPGLAKKRAMLGLDPNKPVLSQVLREAKARAEEEDRIREEKLEAKEVHYERLFDDFEGLVHLEALEMLSKQISMRIDEQLRAATPEQRHDIKETLQQVAELCEMPEEEETEESDNEAEGNEKEGESGILLRRLQRATRDLGAKLSFQPIVKQYEDVISWLKTTEDGSIKAVNKQAMSSLAQATALSVQLYHKAGEMLLVKSRRSTADEADALLQMTVVLTKHTSDLATRFTEKLHSIPTEDSAQCNTYITNIFLEAGNSATYIQNAFLLTQPIIQIGAI